MRRISPWLTNKQVEKMMDEPVRFYEAAAIMSADTPEKHEAAVRSNMIEMMTKSILEQIARTEILRSAKVKLDVEIVYDEPATEQIEGQFLRMRAVVKDCPREVD